MYGVRVLSGKNLQLANFIHYSLPFNGSLLQFLPYLGHFSVFFSS